jgi:hypothetical protein
LKALIVTGNPVDGFKFIGPFDTRDDAVDSASRGEIDKDWWVADLHPVERLAPEPDLWAE